jgi:uncharacterized protein YecE (DUF72 family)
MSGSIHIGTSGFSYKHWKGLFYPEGVKPSQYLAYYAQHFSTTEINASFYRLPAEETITKWAAQVSKDFKFCPKMSRYLSHMKKLRDPEEPMHRFFSIFAPLRRMMGPVLIQLPDRLLFKADIVEHFYKLCRSEYKAYDFVMEVRNSSWMTTESLKMMKKYRIGLVIAQSGVHFPYSEAITAKTIYLRFHGPRELYASSYSDEQLSEFAGKFKAWKAKGHNVWAFFNNDIHAYAPEDARRLEAMVSTQ